MIKKNKYRMIYHLGSRVSLVLASFVVGTLLVCTALVVEE